ncbi:hypothetical protein E1301_Tti010104 [Triplophysa tibetana]|uniref:CARD domain-containing protein n=1 Tax=Triplophysa tibetana TaxID=1572043 RepID=A0A5A9P0S9_9TELE|nr:hypothetical protein E1301_Tti010104 [Triplophysa tibetana]
MDKTVLRNKLKLVNWLSGDPFFLQHVQSREFITHSEYGMLKSIPVAQNQVIELLDIILKKGEKVCGYFLEMLSEDDVNAFSPELRDWIKTVKNSDCEVFLKEKKSLLVQRVKHIDLIVDDLDLHSESYGSIRAEATDQNKMRKLLDYINSKTIAERLVDALFKYESDLMNDLCS